MSLTATQHAQQRKQEARFYHHLVNHRPLSTQARKWMIDNGKGYSDRTLARFNIHKGTLQRFDKEAGRGSRGFVFSDPCIVIRVGPILRCYRYLRPKDERWCVVPAGQGAQWLGDLSHPEPIICEGEWDFLRLDDQGFDNALTHTAGAGTWHPHWTPLFTSKRCRICYDRDGKGQEGAAKVARNIFPVAREVRLICLPLPGTPDLKDVSDFFRRGGTKQAFEELLKKAKPYEPAIFYTKRHRVLLRSGFSYLSNPHR